MAKISLLIIVTKRLGSFIGARQPRNRRFLLLFGCHRPSDPASLSVHQRPSSDVSISTRPVLTLRPSHLFVCCLDAAQPSEWTVPLDRFRRQPRGRCLSFFGLPAAAAINRALGESGRPICSPHVSSSDALTSCSVSAVVGGPSHRSAFVSSQWPEGAELDRRGISLYRAIRADRNLAKTQKNEVKVDAGAAAAALGFGQGRSVAVRTQRLPGRRGERRMRPHLGRTRQIQRLRSHAERLLRRRGSLPGGQHLHHLQRRQRRPGPSFDLSSCGDPRTGMDARTTGNSRRTVSGRDAHSGTQVSYPPTSHLFIIYYFIFFNIIIIIIIIILLYFILFYFILF